jgi:DNA-binding protein HU-beta
VIKQELVQVASKKSGLTIKETAAALESIIETIYDTVGAGEEVRINNFLTFQVKKQAARVGRNPLTGEAVNVPEKNRLTVKLATALKKAVN